MTTIKAGQSDSEMLEAPPWLQGLTDMEKVNNTTKEKPEKRQEM